MKRKRNWVRVVQQSFGGEQEFSMIPSGYIDLHAKNRTDYEVSHSSPIHLRTALECVRDNKLNYRWATPTFQNERFLDEMPMLATMAFGPWAAFSCTRRKKRDSPLIGSHSIWMTYFCFSRDEDRLLFKIVWS
jgi:hypothetical protein